MKRIAVFCGSSPGSKPEYIAMAVRLGKKLAESHIELVYGGGNVGMMAELSDGFIALPGELGTLDEMFEILPGAQLNIHQKPCGFLNVSGYYDKLIEFIDHMIAQNFVKKEYRALMEIDDDPAGLLEKFRQYKPLNIDKGEWAKQLAVNE